MQNEQRTTGEISVSKTKEETIKEARRIEENCTYSAKGHFAAADMWRKVHFYIGVPTAILAATASAFAFAQFGGHHIIAGLLAIAVAILSGVTTFLTPSDKANLHLSSGNSYDSLVSRTRVFRCIECWGGDSDRVLSTRLKDLSEERNVLNAKSPQIPEWAYRKAKKGIEAGECSYEVDQAAG